MNKNSHIIRLPIWQQFEISGEGKSIIVLLLFIALEVV